jgi:hypothetical protein
VELSTREDLIPVIREDRPAIIKQDGWTIYLSIHDAQYLRTVKDLKSAVINAHPDKHCIDGQTTPRAHAIYRKKVLDLMRFKISERNWYWKLRLMPPDWRGPLTPPQGWRPKRRLT